MKPITWLMGAWLFLSALGCKASSHAGDEIRQPAVAGAFYPSDPKELDALVTRLLSQTAAPVLSGAPVAVLAPHAGYVFSGAIAAASLKILAKVKLDTIYVLGTSHYAPGSGAWIWIGKAFRTPLGDYPVDAAAARELVAACSDIRELPEAWTQEHSVEVQVPFLQKLQPHAKLVPIIMSSSSLSVCQSVATAIAQQAARRQAVLIASTDLSHYPAQLNAQRVDTAMLQTICTLNAEDTDSLDKRLLSQNIPNLACTLCGLSAVETVMLAGRQLGANQAQLIRYANSGDTAGDPARVVGYGSVAFVRVAGRPALPAENISDPSAATLTVDQRQRLLRLARESIAARLGLGNQPKMEKNAEWLQAKRAAFVTLKRDGQLRGCIGMTEAVLPLQQVVARMACAAAFEDPRFVPLTAGELATTEIEISLLSPLRRIQNPSEIVLGTHGVVVKAGENSGIFLPQVASESGWSKEKFLDELCSQKAGLPANAWKNPDTNLYIFTVQSFASTGERP